MLQQTAKRQPSTTASEAYLTHVYGKPAYQNQRSTVRSPYLRFQTVSKTKPAVQLPKSPVLVEGVLLTYLFLLGLVMVDLTEVCCIVSVVPSHSPLLLHSCIPIQFCGNHLLFVQ